MMKIVEFPGAKSGIDAELQAIEFGRVIRLICETQEGSIDVTEQEKQRLRPGARLRIFAA
jgi:hypothetical protein